MISSPLLGERVAAHRGRVRGLVRGIPPPAFVSPDVAPASGRHLGCSASFAGVIPTPLLCVIPSETRNLLFRRSGGLTSPSEMVAARLVFVSRVLFWFCSAGLVLQPCGSSSSFRLQTLLVEKPQGRTGQRPLRGWRRHSAWSVCDLAKRDVLLMIKWHAAHCDDPAPPPTHDATLKPLSFARRRHQKSMSAPPAQ